MQVVAVDGRVCPGCGTRAKAKWEFCPRCGESLANATAEAPRAEAVAEASPADEGIGGSWKGIAGALVAVAVAIFAFVEFRHPGPPPDAGVFAIPAESNAPPASGPRVVRKGGDAFQKGRLLLAEGNVEAATPLLAQAAQEDSENALYRHTYGRALWLRNSKDAALNELAAATQLNPESPVYWTELGRAQKELGRTSEALRSFERATSIFPENIDMLKDYGTLLARLDDRQRAATILKKVADKRPDDPQLQQEMAYALEATGDLANAEVVYRRVVSAVPEGAVVARSRLAEVLLQQNRPADAVAVLREGLEQTPDRSLLYRSLGSLLERTGKVSEAVAAYREYVQRAGDTPDAKEIAQRAAALERQLAARS